MRRISIRSLMALVMVFAVGLAAICIGSAAWAGAMMSITFFVLTCSLLGAVLGRGERRIYWSGFAVLGWSYVLLTHAPLLDVRIGQHLLAPNLFVYLHEILHGVQPAAVGGGFQSVSLGPLGATVAGGGMGGVGASFVDLGDFVRIGYAMEALLWAFLGGWAARYFASRDGGRTESQSDRAPQGD